MTPKKGVPPPGSKPGGLTGSIGPFRVSPQIVRLERENRYQRRLLRAWLKAADIYYKFPGFRWPYRMTEALLKRKRP